MKKQLLGWTAAALLFPFFAAEANDKHDAFLKAEKKARYGDYQDMKEAASGLDHPLKPYVEKAYWQRVTRVLNTRQKSRTILMFTKTRH